MVVPKIATNISIKSLLNLIIGTNVDLTTFIHSGFVKKGTAMYKNNDRHKYFKIATIL